jgi:putative membrane protein
MNFIIKLILNSIAVFLTAKLLSSGVHLESSWYIAVALAALLAILNSLVKPVLIFLTIPATVLTLGLFLLVINALIIEIAAWILPEFRVDSFWWALLFSIVLSLVNGVFERLTVKKQYREDSVKVFDKDGNRIV